MSFITSASDDEESESHHEWVEFSQPPKIAPRLPDPTTSVGGILSSKPTLLVDLKPPIPGWAFRAFFHSFIIRAVNDLDRARATVIGD